jgi:hypothetical protein
MLAFGHVSARTPRASVAIAKRGRFFALACRLETGPALLGPIEQILEFIDDATAVATKSRSLLLPAQIIEGAPVNAQQLGRFIDGEKGNFIRAVVPGHEITPYNRHGECRAFSGMLGGMDSAPPGNRHTYLRKSR